MMALGEGWSPMASLDAETDIKPIIIIMIIIIIIEIVKIAPDRIVDCTLTKPP